MYVLAHSIAVEETMFVGTIVLMSLVFTIATAHQVNIAVMMKAILVNVLKHVLEDRVSMIPTARQENHVVVLIAHVP